MLQGLWQVKHFCWEIVVCAGQEVLPSCLLLPCATCLRCGVDTFASEVGNCLLPVQEQALIDVTDDEQEVQKASAPRVALDVGPIEAATEATPKAVASQQPAADQAAAPSIVSIHASVAVVHCCRVW